MEKETRTFREKTGGAQTGPIRRFAPRGKEAPMEALTKEQLRAAARIENPDVRAIVLQPPSDTDPNGSYTGIPADGDTKPVQDADDL